MKEKVGLEPRQPYRLLIGYEMHDMAFVCQGFAQFSGQNTTSPEGGITNDTDFHVRKFQ
jgi:hypothetical protein